MANREYHYFTRLAKLIDIFSFTLLLLVSFQITVSYTSTITSSRPLADSKSESVRSSTLDNSSQPSKSPSISQPIQQYKVNDESDTEQRQEINRTGSKEPQILLLKLSEIKNATIPSAFEKQSSSGETPSISTTTTIGDSNHTSSERSPKIASLSDFTNKSTPSGDSWKNTWNVFHDGSVEIIQACDETNTSNAFIYCYGRLLEAVNSFSLFYDSKTFVDKPLKFSPDEVRKKFSEQFPVSEPEKLNRQSLIQFVSENFDHEGTELMTCELNDWNENPVLLADIRDQTLKDWALELNQIWRKLCRQITPKIHENPERYSLIYVPKPFVAPGGRFRELYYWDAYWIIKGLIASGMVETARHMIENFLYLVENYGFIPNGARVYYLKRSQPPLLSAMVYEYYEATHDFNFIANALPTLEKELWFWETRRNISVEVEGQNFTVFQYRAESNVPRPESYREDIDVTKQLTKPADKHRIWKNIATSAESGWDFSTRWMSDPDHPDLSELDTTNIVEVDLNAFICWNYDILSYLFLEMDNEAKSNEYRDRHFQFRSTFRKVFYVWDREGDKAGWYDYNMRTKVHNLRFYPSIAVPLFTRCYSAINTIQSQRIFRTMEEFGVFKFPGGVPSSLNKNSGQQWDWPNGWPPSNHMIIEGLRRSGHPLMQQKAFWLAEKWVLANYRVYRNTHSSMWEKYNVVDETLIEGLNRTSPDLGSGGEYDVQAGFGWTNGVILDLLATYGDRMYFHNLEEDPTGVAHKVINSEPKNNFTHVTETSEIDEKQTDSRQRGVLVGPPVSITLNSAASTSTTSIVSIFMISVTLYLFPGHLRW